ncbi:hypothetical protein [Parvicella tangerina]|uniref:Uncharacterized protein n=1 Tax=Parvicella tangerina TaxID=2829795 RepID=A0A916JJY4_9FLAO|nr:hypothetical protein [Parvicella tangerina]CAG5076799.1 hypothetical protein CRYO30217_00204 [Parvicella tangerina]
MNEDLIDSDQPPEDDVSFSKIFLINLIIMLTYSILLRALVGFGAKGEAVVLGFGIFMILAVGAHFIIGLIVGFIWRFHSNAKFRSQGNYQLITSIFMLIIGFGTCLGGISI